MSTAPSTSPDQVDVVVIGGGAAGLSGALVLGRSRRSVLLVDAGSPRNAPSAHAHNLLTRDGVSPAEIYALGRRDLAPYGVSIVDGRVDAVTRDEGDQRHPFTVTYDDTAVRARRVLVATGLRDQLPELPGLAERWGRDVLHCPYCHGWEVRDQRVGVLATGPMAGHQALLFRQLTDRVTLLQHTGPDLTDDQRAEFAALGISVVAGEVVAVESADDHLTGVRVGDRSIELDALVVGPVMTPRAEFLEPLGLKPVEFLMGEHVIGARIEADLRGATSVPGLYVAGNVTDLQAQIVGAAAEGVMAGAMINADLVTEDARTAVAARP